MLVTLLPWHPSPSPLHLLSVVSVASPQPLIKFLPLLLWDQLESSRASHVSIFLCSRTCKSIHRIWHTVLRLNFSLVFIGQIKIDQIHHSVDIVATFSSLKLKEMSSLPLLPPILHGCPNYSEPL